MGEQGATRYRLVIQSFHARHHESLADILVRVLGMPPARAQELASGIPCAVGSTALIEHARHYAAALTEAGAELRIEPPLPAVEPAPSSTHYALGELSLDKHHPPPRPTAMPRAEAPACGDLSLRNALTDHGLGGMRDLGESLEALASGKAPVLEVDPDALRAIRPEVHPSARGKPSLAARLWERVLRPLARGAGGLVSGALAFIVVIAVTAAAVSYALDPNHVLDAVAYTRAKESVQAVIGHLSGTLSPGFPAP